MHPQVEKIILRSKSFIDHHLSDPIDGEEIARQAFLSYFHFQHQFRRATGESLWQYVKRLRLERAAFLLAYTNLPVAEIAAGCGFEATASLSKTFRKKWGLSPQQYRRKVQQHREAQLPLVDWNQVTTHRLPPQTIISFRSEGLRRFPQGYFQWMEHIRAGQSLPAPLFGTSPDQPGVTAGNKIRWDTGVPVQRLPAPLHGVLLEQELIREETFPGGNYLVLPFCGFGTSFTLHLPSLLVRLQQEGLEWRPSGRLFQVLEEHAPDSCCATSVYIPIR